MKEDEIIAVWECEVDNIHGSSFWGNCQNGTKSDSFMWDVEDIQKDEKDLLEIGAKFLYVQLRTFYPSVTKIDYITFKNKLLPHD